MPIANFHFREQGKIFVPYKTTCEPDELLDFALERGAVFATYPMGYMADITPEQWRDESQYTRIALEMRKATAEAAKLHIFDADDDSVVGVAHSQSGESFGVAVRTVYIPQQVAYVGITHFMSDDEVELGSIVARVSEEYIASHAKFWVGEVST